MNKEEQLEFVTELIHNVRDDLLQKFDEHTTPDNWDGMELREIIKMEFDVVISRAISRSRKTELNNWLLVNGW